MLTRQIINNKLECEFKQIETQLDFSFDKINNFIDYVFNLDFPISKFTNRKSQTLLPKLDQFQIIPQSDIIQELTPFINSKIKHQVQIKLLSVQGNQQSFTNSTFTKVQQSFASSSQLNLRPFTFQLIKDNPIKQHEWCFAIAFNEDCSIVAAGSDKLIKIYEFRQGNLRLIQLLNKHLNWVSILNFMKNPINFSLEIMMELFLFGQAIIIMNGFGHKHLNNKMAVQIVQLCIIMKIVLYQVVMIRLLSFG